MIKKNEKLLIRIRFNGFSSADEQQIRKFLHNGVMQKTLIPLINHSERVAQEEREDFRVAFTKSKIILFPQNSPPGTEELECNMINMSAGGFMVSTKTFHTFKVGEVVKFRLSFLHKSRYYSGIVEGISLVSS